MARYFLAYRAPKAFRMFCETVRKDLQAAEVECLNRAPPHATVLVPREYDEGHALELIARSQMHCRSVWPFYARSRQIESFPTLPNMQTGELHVSFDGIGVEEAFSSLVRTLSAGLSPEPFEGKTLHMTVAEVPIAQLSFARYRCAFHKPPEYALFERLAWYRQEQRGGPWEEVEQVACHTPFVRI